MTIRTVRVGRRRRTGIPLVLLVVLASGLVGAGPAGATGLPTTSSGFVVPPIPPEVVTVLEDRAPAHVEATVTGDPGWNEGGPVDWDGLVVGEPLTVVSLTPPGYDLDEARVLGPTAPADVLTAADEWCAPVTAPGLDPSGLVCVADAGDGPDIVSYGQIDLPGGGFDVDALLHIGPALLGLVGDEIVPLDETARTELSGPRPVPEVAERLARRSAEYRAIEAAEGPLAGPGLSLFEATPQEQADWDAWVAESRSRTEQGGALDRLVVPGAAVLLVAAAAVVVLRVRRGRGAR